VGQLRVLLLLLLLPVPGSRLPAVENAGEVPSRNDGGERREAMAAPFRAVDKRMERIQGQTDGHDMRLGEQQ
jgi:hypothetical protein